MPWELVNYADLNNRQKENYNFHKTAGRLADYGFNSLRLTDDWKGADFLACHKNGDVLLKVQQKGPVSVDKKYNGKDLFIAFRYAKLELIGIFHHDDFLKEAFPRIENTKSWKRDGAYLWPTPPQWMRNSPNIKWF